ncbi:FAD/NAD(P)-binding domain-containing protein [Plenodomus tracheiphilus IPT5]|uniref:FAD/NAD(P)-binding domain-containing protein n=1 Tax=Plenodomus tracheiphilus IPT5 TaxID=1408161 RepID=A0A6A7AZN5_9PLEO|nr:FAD/NAD(P)-binding domain-containing protein [Plenodomus tracheiphilus IPT5]
MSRPRALVIGASIAGPSIALWLSRAGFHITIIERFPNLRTGGQAVDIRTSGVPVMRRMADMEARVQANSTQEEGVSFIRADGTPYGVIKSTGNSECQGIAQVLYGLTKELEGVEYVFGEQVVSMRHDERNDGRVEVEFANSLLTQTFDLVVACDGATSRTRAMAFGCGVREHVVCWAAYFSTKQDLLSGSKVGQGFSAVGGCFISIASDTNGSSRVMLMSHFPRNGADCTLPFREAARAGLSELKGYITQQYRGAGWIADQLLDEMMGSDDFYASEIVQIKMPILHKGGVVLVGDSGYAAGPTGGGTSLALMGAYMLAGELSKHKDGIATGMNGYEDQMRPLIKEMQKIPRLVSSIMAPQTAWGICVRNYLFAIVAWSGIAGHAQTYLGAAFASTDEFPLPGYAL